MLARPARGAAIAVCAGALALGAAACGGDEAGDAEPGAAVPASAPVYFEVTVRPDGDLKSDAEAAFEKVFQSDDPAALLQGALFDGDVSYDDIEPWLGEHAGVFFTSFSGDSADGAAVIEQTDSDAAKSFVETQAKDDGAEERTHNDVTYWAQDESAYAVVDDYVVAGTERGLKTVVDTLKADDVATLEDSEQYEQALDALEGEEDALAIAYVSTQGLLDALSRSGGIPPDALSSLRQTIVATGGTASAMKLSADGDAIAVESATIGAKDPAADEGSDASAAVAGLPGDSWLGLGVGGIGSSLDAALDQVSQAGAMGGVDVEQLLEQFRQGLGLDIREDLLSWMGDGALFARGTTIADIGGALVVQSSDPKATAQAIDKVKNLVSQASPGTKVAPLTGIDGADDGIMLSDPSAPVQVIMAVGDGKFVLGVGRQAVEAALAPQTTLADSDTFKAAGSALDGMAPAFFVDIAPIVALAEGIGAGDSPEWAQARKHIDAFASVAAGSEQDGDVQRAKLVATLK